MSYVTTIKPRNNVTVVPLNFQSMTGTVSSQNRPRTNSKIKLSIVSPSPKNNHLTLKETRLSQQMHYGSIELGGKSAQWQHAQKREQKIVNQTKQVHQHARRSTNLQFSVIPPVIMPDLRVSCPMNKKATQPHFIDHSHPASMISPHHRTNSDLTSIIRSLNGSQCACINVCSDLAGKKENSVEKLKGNYECEIREIKKLQEQIFQNNQQIKNLLNKNQSSQNIKLSKNTKSSTDNKPLNEEEGNCKQNVIPSKHTFINDLKTQILNQSDQSEQIPHDDMPLQGFEKSFTKAVINAERLSLTKNSDCQVQVIADKSQATSPQSSYCSIAPQSKCKINFNETITNNGQVVFQKQAEKQCNNKMDSPSNSSKEMRYSIIQTQERKKLLKSKGSDLNLKMSIKQQTSSKTQLRDYDQNIEKDHQRPVPAFQLLLQSTHKNVKDGLKKEKPEEQKKERKIHHRIYL